jgi:predicted regulator of Ras-like GTPase activity (Roadblock/LC7/MglB family)
MPDSNNGSLVATLCEMLRNFQTATPGVLGCGIISADGFTIASELPDSIEEQRVAAMAAAMHALGEQTTQEFSQGTLQRVYVEGERGHVIVMSAGPESLLSAVVRKDAKLGLVFLQMQRAVENIRRAMNGDDA